MEKKEADKIDLKIQKNESVTSEELNALWNFKFNNEQKQK